MMVGCCIIGCQSNNGKNEPGISFHRFPRDLEKKKLWIANIRNDDWKPSKNERICSKHFESRWFYRTDSNLKSRLLNQAVPTILPLLPSCPNPKETKKRNPVISDCNSVHTFLNTEHGTSTSAGSSSETKMVKILREKLIRAYVKNKKKSDIIRVLKQSLKRQGNKLVSLRHLASSLKKQQIFEIF